MTPRQPAGGNDDAAHRRGGAGPQSDSAQFFDSPAAFRAWLERQHASAAELWVGFWKRGTGRPSLTWPESVDQALCYGWIDGMRRSLGEDAYAIRFTPRKPGSTWSAKNVKRAEELTALGLMRPPGLAVFAARDPARTNLYSFEREQAALAPDEERALRANVRAWSWFQAQPPSYRKPVLHWIVSAKQEATRRRRLETLIRCSEAGEAVPPMRFGKPKK